MAFDMVKNRILLNGGTLLFIKKKSAASLLLPTVLLALFFLGCVFTGCVNEVPSSNCEKAGTCELNKGISCSFDSECGDGLCVGGFCETGLNITPNVDGGSPVVVVPNGDGIAAVLPGREVDFGSPLLNVSVDQVVQVQNLGSGPMLFANIVRDSATSDEFTWSLDVALPFTLQAQETLDVTLHYTLADGEEDLGRLFFATDASTCSPACENPAKIAIDLLSEFKGARNLDVTPENAEFGYVPVGQVSSAISVLLTNIGTIDKILTVDSLEVMGDVASFDFSLPSLPLYIAPGQSVEVPVVYSPSAFSSLDSLTFTAHANSDRAENVTLSSTLTATSQPPNALVFTPPVLVFSDVNVGNTMQQISQLKNVGATAISVSRLRVGQQLPVEYVVSTVQTLPYTLLPNAEMTVYVDFSPQLDQASSTTVHALNDQASGLAPVLNLQGAGYIPPGGPNVEVVMGPETIVDADCFCQAAPGVSTANVDLIYRSIESNQSCGKPADPSCGINGTCPCGSMSNYGSLNWGSARTEEVRGQQWIIDERVNHTGIGQDGTFAVRANLLDDCLAVMGSASRAVNFACIELDCNTAWNAGATQSCFDYGETPICSVEAEYYSLYYSECMQRGPVAIKTRVRIYGGTGADEIREFCTTLSGTGSGRDVVQLNKNAGYFTFGAVQPNVLEVALGEPCS